MKKGIQKKLCLYLAVLLALPVILGVMSPTSVSAAANSSPVRWHRFDSVKTIKVEQYRTFYLGDYLTDGGRQVSALKASYSSSNSSVISVKKSTGYAYAKKPGTAKLTIRYKNKNYSRTFTVVNYKTFKTYDKLCTLAKQIGSTKVSNASAMVQAIKNYETEEARLREKGKFLMDGITFSNDYKTANLVAPMALRISYIRDGNSPLATTATTFISPVAASASVKNKTFTFSLKKTVTANQILYTRFFTGYTLDSLPKSVRSQVSNSGKNAVFVLGTNSKKDWNGETTYLLCKITKGSNKMTAKRLYWDNKKIDFYIGSLKKGKTYKFYAPGRGWEKVISATAK